MRGCSLCSYYNVISLRIPEAHANALKVILHSPLSCRFATPRKGESRPAADRGAGTCATACHSQVSAATRRAPALPASPRQSPPRLSSVLVAVVVVVARWILNVATCLTLAWCMLCLSHHMVVLSPAVTAPKFRKKLQNLSVKGRWGGGLVGW